MKKSLSVFVLFFVSLLLIGATSWAADPVTTAPARAPVKTLKPVPLKPPATTQPVAIPADKKTAQLMKFVNSAKSLQEIDAEFVRLAFSPEELVRLQGAMTSAPEARKKIDALAAQTVAVKSPEMERLRIDQEAKVARMRNQEAQALKLRQEQVADRIRNSTPVQISTPDPNVRCRADFPSIDPEQVADVLEPGYLFVVNGKGFGPAPGSVDVMLQGKIYRAFVEKWNACEAVARLPTAMTGLLSGSAAVVVKTREGMEATGKSYFQAEMDYEYVHETKSLISYCCGNHAEWSFYGYQLENQWLLVESVLSHRGGGHCDLKKSPLLPGSGTRVRVHAGVGGFDKVYCHVDQVRQGPKGLPSH